MQPANPNILPIDPRSLVRNEGADALLRLLRDSAGYVCQTRPLKALVKSLRRNKPLLCEGKRGAGKTALAESLAIACNLPVFYLQCMDGLNIADVLYQWDTTAQNQFVEQQARAGVPLVEAQAAQWTRQFLKLGEILEAFDLASRRAATPLDGMAELYDMPPVAIIDEIDKLDEKGEDTLLQLLARGYASVPRLSPDNRVGIVEPGVAWPIVILTSNNMRGGISAPLRSRCYYTNIQAPSRAEEIRILSTRVPAASQSLLAQTAKMMHYIRGMGGVVDKPEMREAIDFLQTLVDEGVESLSRQIIDENICCLAKRESDVDNLENAVARLAQIALTEDKLIDGWAAEAFVATRPTIVEEGGVLV